MNDHKLGTNVFTHTTHMFIRIVLSEKDASMTIQYYRFISI